MIRHLLQTLRFLVITALAGAAWVAHRPAPLPAVPQPSTTKADDMLDMLGQAVIKRAAVVTVSEDDLNRHLAVTLAGKVGNGLGRWASFDGARVDLEPELARLFLVWKVFGQTRTASVDLVITRDDENFHVELARGAYGHLRMPRGMMRPLYPALRSVADALDPEIRTLFKMTRITLAKDKLVLDTRFPNT